jgi:hypothetical protein
VILAGIPAFFGFRALNRKRARGEET